MARHPLPLSERVRLAFVARPLAWGAGAAALGVLAGDGLGWRGAALPLVAAAVVGLAVSAVGRKAAGSGKAFRHAEWLGPLGYLACLALTCAMMAAWSCVKAQPGPRDISRLIGQRVGVTGTVVTEPELSLSGRTRFLLECETAEEADGRAQVDGRLFVSAREAVALGDRIEVFGILQEPRPATVPGGFSEADWLRRRGAFAVLRAHPRAVLPLPQAARFDWRFQPARWRRRLTAANARALRSRADLVNSLIFGALDVGDPQAWQDRMQRYRYAGLVHLLVVSGTQVMLIVGPLLALLRLASGSRTATILVLLLMGFLVGAYALMAGAGASVLRAVVMGLLFAIAWPLRREPDIENTLGLAVLLFLIASPSSLYDIGLQLSLAAVWSLARLTRPLRELLDRAVPGAVAAERYPRFASARRSLVTILAASLAATLATTPFIAHYFDQFAPVAILANPFALPLAGILLYAGLCGSVLNLWGAALAAPVNRLTGMLADVLDAVAGFFAQLTGGHLEVFPPGWGAVALAFAGFALWSAWVRGQRDQEKVGKRRAPPKVSAALLLPAILPLAWGMAVPAAPPRALEVTFLDVGQGDSALVRLPQGPVLLIDGGGLPAGEFDVGDRVVLPALRALRVRRIDLLILTHPHDDHVGGLVAVAERYPIGTVLDSAQPAPSANYRRFLRAVRDRHLRYLRGRQGMELRWGDTRLEILHPGERFLSGTRSDLNNNSVVCRLLYGHIRLLFAGDAEAEAEAEIRASGRDLRAEVLKVGHHGSRFSTDDVWLAAVRPALAVVSCGRDNIFGHPAPATLARLNAAGARVFRTDEDGTVTMRCDGERVWAERFVERSSGVGGNR